MSVSDLGIAARVRLGISRRQWLVLENLLAREASTYEGLQAIIYGGHPPVSPRVGICCLVSALRDKLSPLGIRISTIHELGYAMTRDHRKKLVAMLANED